MDPDPSVAPRRITEGLKTETAAIWEPYGIRIEWIDDTISGRPANGVSLDASIDRHFETPRQMQWPTVLGRVTTTPRPPNWEPIRLSLDATRSVLARRPTSRTSIVGLVLDQELARALGRVLAHEIGHVLLNVRSHDRVGLMRAVFRPDQLADNDRAPFRLACGSVARLRERLSALAPSMPELPGGAQCEAFQSLR